MIPAILFLAVCAASSVTQVLAFQIYEGSVRQAEYITPSVNQRAIVRVAKNRRLRYGLRLLLAVAGIVLAITYLLPHPPRLFAIVFVISSEAANMGLTLADLWMIREMRRHDSVDGGHEITTTTTTKTLTTEKNVEPSDGE